MELTITLNETLAEALQYCFDNKISVIDTDAELKSATDLQTVISGLIERILESSVTKMNQDQDKQLLTTLKASPEMLAQVTTALADSKIAVGKTLTEGIL